MIKFPCHCSHVFVLDDDQAGGLVQCPRCRRLNDVPTLSDLQAIEADGTLKVEDDIIPLEPERVETLKRVFTRSRVDEHGEEIDLTLREEDLEQVGDPLDLVPQEQPRPIKPKYDPVTGELIRDIDIKRDNETPTAIPVAQRAVDYATVGMDFPLTLTHILGQLFLPVNMFVMLFVLLGYSILHAAVAVSLLIFLLFPAALVLLILIIAHYGCVIDETGPGLADELPRPLRHCEFYADIWAPFMAMVSGVMIAYAPAWLVLQQDAIPSAVRTTLAGILAVAGTIFTPALLLTTNTSGSPLNLRPDRVLAVVRHCGWRYWPALLLWVVALTLNVTGFYFVLFAMLAQPSQKVGIWKFVSGPVAYPILFLGIYLMHAFCWQLGCLYRRYHASFPWVLQQHEYKNRTTLPPRRKKRRHVPGGAPAGPSQTPGGPPNIR